MSVVVRDAPAEVTLNRCVVVEVTFYIHNTIELQVGFTGHLGL